MQIMISHSEFVDILIKDTKEGRETAESATEVLRAKDIYVGRGTRRRLLQAEATAILNADHSHIAG